MFTDLSACLDQNFLVGSHTDGIISVFNLNTNTSELVREPFGQVDVIWGVIVFDVKPPGEPQTLFIPSSNGFYLCVLTP